MIYTTNTRKQGRSLHAWHAFESRDMPMKSLCGFKELHIDECHKLSANDSTVQLMSMCVLCKGIIDANNGYDPRTTVKVKSKHCRGCNRDRNSGHFHTCRRSKIGLKSYCKECCTRSERIRKLRKDTR